MVPMQVKYALLEKDIQKYTWLLSKKSLFPVALIVIMALMIATGTSNFLIKQNFYEHAPQMVKALTFPLLTILSFRLIFKFFARYSPKNYHPEGYFLTPKEITIDKEGVHQSDIHSTYMLKWTGVVNIKDNADYILIYNDTLAAICIPKRFFSSSEEASNFVEQAKGYWKKTEKNADEEIPKVPWRQVKITSEADKTESDPA